MKPAAHPKNFLTAWLHAVFFIGFSWEFHCLFQEKEINKLVNKIADNKVKPEIKWNKIEPRDEIFPYITFKTR